MKTVNGQQVDPDDTAALAQLIIGKKNFKLKLSPAVFLVDLKC